MPFEIESLLASLIFKAATFGSFYYINDSRLLISAPAESTLFYWLTADSFTTLSLTTLAFELIYFKGEGASLADYFAAIDSLLGALFAIAVLLFCLFSSNFLVREFL
jgi:hypothetical protein